MGDKRFYISDIIEEPLRAPVPVWRTTEMTCAELYNSLWERFCWADEFYNADCNEIRESLRPLAEYLSAILYERWSRSADIDKEPELQERIDSVLLDSDLSNAPFASYRPWFSDHNEDDFVFNPDDNLSEWLGEQLSDVALSMSGMGGRAGGHDIDEDFIWMVNEREPGAKPCFKAHGWEEVVESMLGEMSLIWASVASGISIVLIERESVGNHSWKDDFEYMELTSTEEIRKLAHDDIVTRENTRVLVVDSDELAQKTGYDLVEFLEVMKLVPDGVERFLVFGCEWRSKTNLRKIAETVEKVGIPVLCAPNDGDGDLHAELHGKVNVQYSKRSPYRYNGALPSDVMAEFDEVLSYFEVYSILDSMFKQPQEHDELRHHILAGGAYGGEEEEDVMTKHPDHEALSEISRRHSLKVSLAQDFGISRLASELSFGAVELSEAAGKAMRSEDMLTWRYFRVCNVYEDVIEDSGPEAFPTPKLDMLRLVHKLYKREKIFYAGDEWYPHTLYDDGNEADGTCSEHAEAFERRVRECIDSADESGIKSSIEAFAGGVPAEDILA